MSLQIIAGSSGAGKSYQVYQEIIQRAIAHPEQNFIVIVPEQFTMQTQKDLVRMHPQKVLLNIDILSFNRLAYRVFEEVGGNQYPLLEETGKSLVVQKVILDAVRKKELQVLAGTLEKNGAAGQMKSLLSEFMQYGIAPEQISEWITASGTDGLWERKLRDVQCIYQGFKDYLSAQYMTAEEMPEALCRVIGKSNFVKDSTVVLDGFTGFTPMQHLILAELMKLCREVAMVVTIDRREDPLRRDGQHRLFHMSKEMIRKAVKLAEENDCEVRKIRWIDGGEKGRFSQNEAMNFLEQNLFRYGKRNFPAEQQEIHITEAANPAGEMQWIAGMIRKLVREEGLMYREIAIVNGDMETYGKEAVVSLKAAGIPYFLDQKRSVLRSPMVEFVRAAMEMVCKSYSYESVFRFLKSGMTDMEPAEIDLLENYVLALGIRGRKQYEELWIRRPKNAEEPDMERINALRQKFCDMTADFAAGFAERNSTLRRKCEVLYGLLAAQKIQEKGYAQQCRFEESGNAVLAREYAQIYPMLIDLLEKLVEVLGEERMSLSAFRQLLETGLQETKIGLIPPGEDQVLVGDIERTRLKHIKVMFFAGVNEGWIPKPVNRKNMLSENDRERLKAMHVELSPDAREEMYQQRFYLYLTLTKPSKQLYLSYSRENPAGEAILPAYLIGMVRKLFPAIQIKGTEDPYQKLETDAGMQEILLAGLQKLDTLPVDGLFREIVQALAADAEPDPDDSDTGMVRELDFPQLLEAASMRNPTEGIGKWMARTLYGVVLKNSATRLENFAGCAFAHFAKYGLGLQEREIYEFTPADMGTILHAALEKYAKKLEERGLQWGKISDEDSKLISDEAVQEVVYDYGNKILQSSARDRYMIHRITSIMDRTIWALRAQIRQGKFEPMGAEIAFRADELQALNLMLESGEWLQLRGKIDRVDVCDEGGKRYLKIVDYKSGSTKLDLVQLYHGLQMQLMLYLNAILEAEEKKHPEQKVEPAGILYYNIKDPYVDASADEEALRKAFMKELKPNGLVRSERSVLELMDRMFGEGYSSEVIPAGMTKAGALSAYSTVANKENFRTMADFTNHKVRELGGRILAGETRADPYSNGEKKPCNYCPYKALCGFDEKIPGYQYRRIKKEENDDILKKMKEELE